MARQRQTPETRAVDQLNRLWDDARRYRDDKLGQDWDKDTRDFIEVADDGVFRPSYIPQVSIPELQLLSFQEATDLIDINPRIYISKTQDWSERDLDNEYALEAQWKQSKGQLALFYAILWARFTGSGFLLVGCDPMLRQGMGDIFVDVWPPSQVVIDRNATSIADAQYVGLQTKMYRDQLRVRYPEQGDAVAPERAGRSGSLPFESVKGVDLPYGPMQTMGTGIFGSVNTSVELITVRTHMIRDYSVMELPPPQNKNGDPSRMLARPRYAPRWPLGRIVVQAGEKIISDAPNWAPDGRWPLVHVPGGPKLTGFWPVPPIRYTRGIQSLAERMYSQNYENMVRVNRKVALIAATSGIDIEQFANIPAAAYEYNNTAVQGDPVKFVGPDPIDPAYLSLPEKLLEMQRRLQGFPDSRLGATPAGNISQPMMEGAISQSQTLTRMNSRLLAEAVEETGALILMAMQVFFRAERIIPTTVRGSMKPALWHPVDPQQTLFTHLDPASVRPLSEASRANRALLMKKLGLIDNRHALERLGDPDAEEIATAIDKEMTLAALARSGKAKGGG